MIPNNETTKERKLVIYATLHQKQLCIWTNL